MSLVIWSCTKDYDAGAHSGVHDVYALYHSHYTLRSHSVSFIVCILRVGICELYIITSRSKIIGSTGTVEVSLYSERRWVEICSLGAE